MIRCNLITLTLSQNQWPFFLVKSGNLFQLTIFSDSRVIVVIFFNNWCLNSDPNLSFYLNDCIWSGLINDCRLYSSMILFFLQIKRILLISPKLIVKIFDIKVVLTGGLNNRLTLKGHSFKYPTNRWLVTEF